MVESNDLSVAKEYMDSMERVMNMWFNMMHGLYLKISTILMSFALVVIGYLLSYLLDNEHHVGKYETHIGIVALIFLFGSLGSLMASVACGFTHLCKNLAFVQCTANLFAVRHTDATEMYHKILNKEPVEQKKCTNECEEPSPKWWRWQFFTFGFGAGSLIIAVVIDFFTLG